MSDIDVGSWIHKMRKAVENVRQRSTGSGFGAARRIDLGSYMTSQTATTSETTNEKKNDKGDKNDTMKAFKFVPNAYLSENNDAIAKEHLNSESFAKTYVPSFAGLEYECIKGHRYILDGTTMTEFDKDWNYLEPTSVYNCYEKAANIRKNTNVDSYDKPIVAEYMESRIMSNIFPISDVPIRVPCHVCYEKYMRNKNNGGRTRYISMRTNNRDTGDGYDRKEVPASINAQLSRCHVVTPPSPVALTIHPKIRVGCLV